MPSFFCWLRVVNPDSCTVSKKVITEELVGEKYLDDGHNQVSYFTGKETCSVGIVLVVEMLLGRNRDELDFQPL